MTKSDAVGAWRFRSGVMLFVLGFASPALIPLVMKSDLSTGWKTTLSGLLALGVPEVMMVIAAAVMGKAGFDELKRRFGRFLKRYGPPQTVSRARYNLGLVMFVAPLVFGFLGPYIAHHLPTYETHPRWWHVGGDVMFFSSFFVLGGDFWDKVRSLFVHEARAVLPKPKGGTR